MLYYEVTCKKEKKKKNNLKILNPRTRGMS